MYSFSRSLQSEAWVAKQETMKILTSELVNYKITTASLPGWHQHLRSVFSDYINIRGKDKIQCQSFCKVKLQIWEKIQEFVRSAEVIFEHCWNLRKAVDMQELGRIWSVNSWRRSSQQDENKIKTSKNNDLTLKFLRDVLGKTKVLRLLLFL